MRAKPTYDQPLVVSEVTSNSWYRFFTDLDLGTPPASETGITVKSSPFTYTAARYGNVIVSGGTVSQIKISRSSLHSYATGQNSGQFTLSLGDSVIVTYSGAPTMTFFPL